jgi:hypothetical protein
MLKEAKGKHSKFPGHIQKESFFQERLFVRLQVVTIDEESSPFRVHYIETDNAIIIDMFYLIRS